MKKHRRITVINSQEDEDFEGYTLYPENAIGDSELNKRITKHNPNLKIKRSVTDTSRTSTDIFPLTISRGDD